MDSIRETPLKSLRPNQADDTDSIVDLTSDELDHETLDTLPAPQPHLASQLQSSYVTQPTQLLNPQHQHSPSTTARPTVQVAASSPTRQYQHSSPASQSRTAPPQRLQSIVAPPGTMYKAPAGIRKPPPKQAVIDLSSDEEGPQFHGHTSDEDNTQQARRDIKPSVLKARNPHAPQTNGRVPTSAAATVAKSKEERRSEAMRETLKKYEHKTEDSFFLGLLAGIEGGNTGEKRPADDIAGAYGNSSRPAKAQRVTEPAKATPVTGEKRTADTMASTYGNSSRPAKAPRLVDPINATPPGGDIKLDTLSSERREQIEQIQMILPEASVALCDRMLRESNSDVGDALNKMASILDPPPGVDRFVADDEVQFVSASPKQPLTKQQLKGPARTLQQKYAPVQTQVRPLAAKPASPMKTSQPLPSPKTPTQVPAEPKKRKRLQQGRKRAEPETETPPAKTRKISRAATPLSAPSDSGVASEVESVPDQALAGSLLEFFNTCSIDDLCDLASINKDVAQLVLSKKPFRNLNQIRKIEQPATAPVDGNRKRKATTRKSIGEKIVDQSEKMWTGYQAVESLVEECKEYGKRVANDMKKWGVDVFGASKRGKVDLTNFGGNGDVGNLRDPGSTRDAGNLRDSGIGTPADTDSDESPNKKVISADLAKQMEAANFFPQPPILSEELVMKDYQIVGMNWLALLYRQELSCILADEMGLGKTCQVIAFFAHLLEKGIDEGPHLVVAPASTIENWMREINRFCPALTAYPYHGTMKERENMQYQILENMPDVIVTTYAVAKQKADCKFLRNLSPNVCVYDEGHVLKNAQSKGYEEAMKIKCNFRLLLTGTPLQNNLSELTSLLGFILPNVFEEHREDLESIFGYRAKTTDEEHTSLLSAQRIQRARAMLAPFVLRRKKVQVLDELPKKTRRVEYCHMTDLQRELYEREISRRKRIVADRAAGIKPGRKENDAANNVLMALRQTAIHARLRRNHYAEMPEEIVREYMGDTSDLTRDKKLKRRTQAEDDLAKWSDWYTHTWCRSDPSLQKFCMTGEPFRDSGKVTALVALLKQYKANGDRVLIFSQFTMVMDILEEVLSAEGVLFYRLDGNTKVNERQELLDGFYNNKTVTAFMLSTRAGGAGINLACANKVIIFDSSFNPQDDIQAENRAHRVGQTQEVEVVRLVTRGTVEEQIHALGESKIALDERVAGDVDVEEEEEAVAERKAVAEVERMLDAAVEGKAEEVKASEE